MAGMKLKSHSGASKRLKRTGTGKLRHRQGGRRHLLTGKRRERKRRLKDVVEVNAVRKLAVNRLLPYS